MDIQYVIYIIVGLMLLGGVPATAWFTRAKYAKQLEGPPACLVAEFWPPRGKRYKMRIPIEPSGYEIKAPSGMGHRCPTYFFDKNAIYTTPYPEKPFMPLRFLQIDAPTVAWSLDCPEPIDPNRKPGTEIVTAEMLDIYKDKSFSLLMTAASEALKEMEARYENLLKNVPNKNFMYGLLIAAVVVSLIGGILGYLGYTKLGELAEIWGA